MEAAAGSEAPGPVEFVMIAFDGDTFSGDIAPALFELIDQGLVRVIDMATISKGARGDITIYETQELGPKLAGALARLECSMSGLLSEADLVEVAEDLENGSSAAIILFEHLWAVRFAAAVRKAKGRLVLSERIPPQTVEAARATLPAATA